MHQRPPQDASRPLLCRQLRPAQPCYARAVSDPDWETASQALDDLMRKLLVVHRLLEAEERLANRAPRRNG
jgi:hypothetical protein